MFDTSSHGGICWGAGGASLSSSYRVTFVCMCSGNSWDAFPVCLTSAKLKSAQVQRMPGTEPARCPQSVSLRRTAPIKCQVKEIKLRL